MTTKKFDLLEVRPPSDKEGYYFVTLYQFNPDSPEDPEYFQDWLEFVDGKWNYYGEYIGRVLVCFIHDKKRE